MAPTLLSAAGFLYVLFVVSTAELTNTNFQYQPFDQPNNAAGFDQALSYGGSSGGSPSSGSGSVPAGPSVPTVPDPSYGGSPTPSGSGSVPSMGGGGGSVPTTDPTPTYGGGSGSGSVPSTDPSGGGIGGVPTVPSTGGSSPMPSSGCSCNFWATHINSWPDPLQLISTVSAIFGGLASNTFGPHVTLLSALENPRQDPYSQLLRQGTAAMLNSYAQPHFAYTPLAVRTHFNAALVSPQAAVVQATKFANANRGYGTSTICT